MFRDSQKNAILLSRRAFANTYSYEGENLRLTLDVSDDLAKRLEIAVSKTHFGGIRSASDKQRA